MSNLSDDRKAQLARRLSALRKDFAAELATRVTGIVSHWAACRETLIATQFVGDELDRLQAALHRLTGSAGSFGFARVSELARELEHDVARLTANANADTDASVDINADAARIDAKMAELQQLVTDETDT